MEKVYLLLRNNVQKGPFTASELLQQGLKPKDLIWIEGKSIAWTYVKDVEEIIRLSTAPNQTEANLTQSNMDSLQKEKATPQKERPAILFLDNIEQRAELIRKRAEAFAKEHPSHTYTLPVREERTSVISTYAEENPINLVIHKKSPATITAGQLLMATIVTTVLAAAWNGKISLIPQKINSPYTAIASAPSIFQVQQPKKIIKEVVASAAEPVTVTNVTETSYAAKALMQKKAKQPAAEIPVSQKTETLETTETPITTSTETVIAANHTSTSLQKEENKVKEQPEANRKNDEVNKKPVEEPTATEVSAKKKTLGDAIKGIFKKKKKESPADSIN